MKIFRCLILIAYIITALGVFPEAALAQEQVSSHLEGGIANEREYQEVIFVTGEPVLVKGTARITQSGRNNEIQTRITYNLTDDSGQIKVSRNVTFKSTLEKKLDERQTVTVTHLDRGTETITVGKMRYTLTDYQYSRSLLTDNKPAVEYFSGNWNARKTYSFNNGQGTVVVETWGETVGYDHSWGSTETQKIDGTVTFTGEKTVGEETYKVNWSGTFQLNPSYNRTRSLSYQPNEPTQISFEGGYLETTQEEQVLQYSYNLPRLDEDGLVQKSGRNRGSGSTKLVTSPLYRRLPIPFLRDVKGHWAEHDILRLASLEALPVKGEYLGPRLSMTRGEFAYAIAQLVDLVEEEEQQSKLRYNPYRRNQEPQEVSPFVDVATSHPYYKEIKAISQKGIISGIGGGKFAPDRPLTRAQALTIIIKTIGFEGLAPMYNTTTPYLDDAQIPLWARDAVYVGTEIGLVSGSGGYSLPNETMSRAEAAAFLNRFLSYLQNDLKYEYRERLLNFR